MSRLLFIIISLVSFSNCFAQYDANEYTRESPFFYSTGDFIIGGSYSQDDQEYGIYGRVFVGESLLFNNDALSIDYSFSYSAIKRQLLGTPAPLIIYAMWHPDFYFDIGAEGIALRVFGTILSPIVPEGITYSHYVFNHFVQANLTLKPLQTAYYRDFGNELKARPYSSIEGSLDLIVKETLLITPFYSLGTQWGKPNSHSYIGLKTGFIF